MATQDKRRAGKYDRRIQFLEPIEIVDDFNEQDIEYVVKFDNFPACKVAKTTTDGEDNISNQIQSSLQVNWIIRFLPGLNINTKCRIKDLYDGRVYKIVAPLDEVGRMFEYLIKTEFVE
ncbi:head-tail adaptor protein [Dyadobacter sp. Leaf189]|uniref:phage head completion protein n=1 Tax=Dyadobacter sp. Leaf189 TaxID=1736295 RepID=UPI0006FCDD5C|nr:head-tail adaptor protein [Dyadobacter sp. Leaf189]KQS33968.1 hypothetical protein ASG33_08025 [Dyadobacter sp. Leaf189]